MDSPDPPPPALPYASPAPSAVRFSLSAFISTGILLAVIFFTLVFVVPRFEAIFKDFGTQMPALTIYLLDASRFAVRFWWLCLTVAIAIPIVCGFIIGLVARGGDANPSTRFGRRLSIVGVVLLLLGLYLVLLVIALFLPMINLIQAVSGKS
jgi:type IV pilus assembly protein PilC